MVENNHFDGEAEVVGIIGRGESLETCFADAARIMFALMTDISNIHFIQIITFEFEEPNTEQALVTWLNLLLEKAQEHQLIFGDFRLKRDGHIWKATVSGEPKRDGMLVGVEVKNATTTKLSVKKVEHQWEAKCVVNV